MKYLRTARTRPDWSRPLFHGLALAGLAATVVLTGCGGHSDSAEPAGYNGHFSDADLYQWNGEGMTGKVKIIINLTTQKADIYIGGQYAGWTSVATGKAGFDTPAGDYTIVEKVADKRSSEFGVVADANGTTVIHDANIKKDKVPPGDHFVFAPMPNWMRLTWTGIGMHAGPIPQPGTPASHGCIRLPDAMAKNLFDIVKIGTPVEIVR